MPELRTIYISTSGVAGYMYLHAYDRLGNLIANDVVKYGLVPASQSASTPPSSWVNFNSAYDVRDTTVPLGELRVGFFCGAGGHGSGDQIVPGDFWAWLDITDTPEDEPVNCGKIRFV